MGNPFVHIELNTTDVDSAKQFYKSCSTGSCGHANGQYTMVEVGRGGTAGDGR